MNIILEKTPGWLNMLIEKGKNSKPLLKGLFVRVLLWTKGKKMCTNTGQVFFRRRVLCWKILIQHNEMYLGFTGYLALY